MLIGFSADQGERSLSGSFPFSWDGSMQTLLLFILPMTLKSNESILGIKVSLSRFGMQDLLESLLEQGDSCVQSRDDACIGSIALP